jgi:two-component system chemotaxis response regulator CheB
VVDLIPAGTLHAAERVLLMARVPIVTGPRRPPAAPLPSAPATGPLRRATAAGSEAALPDPDAEVLAIVSSTGGVWVLAELLRSLPPDRVAAVAQHLEDDFVPFFVEWLQSVSGWRAVLVSEPVPYARGVAYVPAGGLDLVVEPGRVRAARACGRYVPNGDRLLRSAGEALGRRAVGVVLSGMGSDGAEGLAEIARCGGRAICQDPATAAVASMPECALRRTASAMAAAPGTLAAAIGPAQRGNSSESAFR